MKKDCIENDIKHLDIANYEHDSKQKTLVRL